MFRVFAGLQSLQQLFRITGNVLALVSAQIDLTKGHPWRLAEPLFFLDHVGGEFLIARVELRGHILKDELQFLAQPTADELIVLIETQFHRLPVKDLVANVFVHDVGQLFRCRLPHHGSGKVRRQHLDLPRRNDNPIRILLHRIVHHAIQQKQSAPDQEEVKQRLLEESFHHF